MLSEQLLPRFADKMVGEVMKYILSVFFAVALFLTLLYGGILTTASITADQESKHPSREWTLYYTY